MPPFIPRKRRRFSPTPPRSTSASTLTSTVTCTTDPLLHHHRRKPTLFETLDATIKSTATVEENQAFLAQLDGDTSDSSSLSSLSSDATADFVDVDISSAPSAKRQRLSANGDVDTVSDEDNVDWEDAIVPAASHVLPTGDLELTLDKSRDYGLENGATGIGKKKGPTKIERQIRVSTHCMHVQFLMWHGAVRNAWICDVELQKILVSQITDTVKDLLDTYKMNAGLVRDSAAIDSPSVANKGAKKRKKGKSDQTKAKNTVFGRERTEDKGTGRAARDWNHGAERLEEGVPNLSKGDPMVILMVEMVKYWRKKFLVDQPGLRKQGYKPLARLEEEIRGFSTEKHDAEVYGERIRDLQDMRKRAKECRGSRDAGAQLLTGLLRGLGLEARLVFSLQPLGFGWSKAEDAVSKKRGKQGKRNKSNAIEAMDDESSEEGDQGGPQRSPAKRTEGISKTNARRRTIKPPPAATFTRAKRRGAKDNPIELPESPPPPPPIDLVVSSADELVSPYFAKKKQPAKAHDADLPFPIFWIEVFSPATNKYIAVDPFALKTVASTDELFASFEPRNAAADKAKQILAYAIAYSADGTAKDVTVRYLKKHVWPGKTRGNRMPVEKVPVYNHRGKIKRYEELDWFKTVMSGYQRTAKQRTSIDELEEQEDLKPVKIVKEAREGRGEETLQSYKSSAEYVLERFLRREEALLPGSVHVKMFASGKGEKAMEEKVFRREDVVACKTSESWHKEGRQVMAGEQPMKLVPMRAMTLNRKREIEQAEADAGGQRMKQGLYSKEQSEWIIPAPIRDGYIPRNTFGNIDCFVPSMVPKGAVHLPHRGLVKICKRLDISHAEAVVGFEFKSQRAVPMAQGVVIPEEREQEVMAEWKKDEEERVRKEDVKRVKLALGLWKKFLMGLRIVARVKEEYGDTDGVGQIREESNPFTNQKSTKRKKEMTKIGLTEDPVGGAVSEDAKMSAQDTQLTGGFVPMEDDGNRAEEDYPLMGGFVPDDEDGMADPEP